MSIVIVLFVITNVAITIIIIIITVISITNATVMNNQSEFLALIIHPVN